MTAKCTVCAIPYGETQCVTCGAEAPQVEVGLVRELYEVGSNGPPILTTIMSIREGVEVEPVRCDKCGELTVSHIESPDGKKGCLKCFREFLKLREPLSQIPEPTLPGRLSSTDLPLQVDSAKVL